MKYHINTSPEMGRGLYANHDLSPNENLFMAELLVLSQDDTVKVNQTDLKYYTFKYNDSQDCLVLSDGEIFNHSDKPNVSYQLINFDGRKVMLFKVITEVKAGQQLFIDYNADVNVDVSKYVDKNLI